MADVIQMEKGSDPWRPSHDAALVKQYRYYDMPLAGIIEQHGVRYYFRCVGGAQDVLSTWGYVVVTPEEEAELDMLGAETVEKSSVQGPMVLAFAVEGLGVVVSTVLDEVNEQTVAAALDHLTEEFDQLAESARHADAQLLIG